MLRFSVAQISQVLKDEHQIDTDGHDRALLAAIIESSEDAIGSTTLDGIIRCWNAGAERLFGFSQSEAVGQHVTLIIPPEGHQEDARMVERLQRGERIEHFETQRVAKDGRRIDVSLTISPLWDEDGNLIGTSRIARDVTARKQAERAVAEAEQQLRLITDHSPVLLVHCDAETRYKFVSKSYADRFGLVPEEIVGKRAVDVLGKEAYSKIQPFIEKVLAGSPVEFEVEVPFKNIGNQHIRCAYMPEFDDHNKVVGWVAAISNISVHKQNEEKLRESEERFRRLMELLPVGVYTCEAPSGQITYYNGHASTLWGRSPNLGDTHERFCGSYRLFHSGGEFLPHDQCPMAVAIREGREFRNQEVEVARPDGSRFTALVNIDPITDEQGNVLAAINVFHDITALKQAEQQLKESDRRKDEFLATLAHELRNPLAPIRNGLSVLQLAEQSGAEVDQVYEMMERQLNHMVRLVDDLLELSRISRGTIELKRERISLASVINHALETSKSSLEEADHTLAVQLPADEVMIDGDSVRLSQVFSNLLNNAAKFTERGGSISLTAKCDGKEALVSVRDTGVGIPPEMLSRVFDIFAQVVSADGRKQDGLGIGLSLVRTLVNLHGGSVEAHSKGLGHGSEFMVRLPIKEEHASKVDGASLIRAESHETPTALRVLAVDDNKDSADSLAMMLRYMGAKAQTAYDGPSAIEAIKESRPAIVVMDLGMPGMDGCEAARLIRQDPDIQRVLLVALTGWGQEEDRRRSKEAGFDHHLVKPVDVDALQTLLASVSSE